MPSLPSPPSTQSQPLPSQTIQAHHPATLAKNTDAIAVRAALSILTLQRQRAEQHIYQLDDLNAAARRDPALFLKALEAGKLRGEDGREVKRRRVEVGDSAEEEDDDDEEEEEEEEDEGEGEEESTFPVFPAPQSIVRCPPINWAKYRILAAPLDKIHELELRAPSLGQPAPPLETDARSTQGRAIGDTRNAESGSGATGLGILEVSSVGAGSSSVAVGKPGITSPGKEKRGTVTKGAGKTVKVSIPSEERGEDVIAAPYRPFEDRVNIAGMRRPKAKGKNETSEDKNEAEEEGGGEDAEMEDESVVQVEPAKLESPGKGRGRGRGRKPKEVKEKGARTRTRKP
ncbi:MAG: hypothetical protein M1814_004057 [Vezdaea aestivalis]|nr:MAG: hypothetical protein M1814_004057 [Vezdaea aestivalis]